MTAPNPANALSRRTALLAMTGAMAAPGAALAAAGPLAATDPIYAAIEQHREAVRATDANLRRTDEMDAAVAAELRETDPTYVAWQRERSELHEAESDAALNLINVAPTTGAGICAVLTYAREAEREYLAFDGQYVDEETGRTETWHYFLHQNIIAALEGMGMVS